VADLLPLDPEDLTLLSAAQNKLSPCLARDFAVNEPVMDFHRVVHSQWFETITRLPMTQDDFIADAVGVEVFPARCWVKLHLATGELPRD